MLAIEFEPPTESVCECCGNSTVRLTRFVLKDGNAHAVYYAQYTRGHDEKRMSGLIGLGEWGDDAGPEDRRAFPFQMWLKGDDTVIGLIDAEDSPWSDATFLGRVLDRDEALTHPWIQEVFHITDHIVTEDPEVIGYFRAQA
jgi:hypothetical protein